MNAEQTKRQNREVNGNQREQVHQEEKLKYENST